MSGESRRTALRRWLAGDGLERPKIAERVDLRDGLGRCFARPKCDCFAVDCKVMCLWRLIQLRGTMLATAKRMLQDVEAVVACVCSVRSSVCSQTGGIGLGSFAGCGREWRTLFRLNFQHDLSNEQRPWCLLVCSRLEAVRVCRVSSEAEVDFKAASGLDFDDAVEKVGFLDFRNLGMIEKHSARFVVELRDDRKIDDVASRQSNRLWSSLC